MKIRVLSDLHINSFNPFAYKHCGEDLVVLAGDIGEGMCGVNVAERSIPEDIPVLYVPGNHEYYGQEYFALRNQFMEYNELGTHVKILDNSRVNIEGVTFVGSTLWTDFSVYKNPISGIIWKNGLNDSKFIKFQNGNINQLNMEYLYELALSYLSEVQPSDVLITHYAFQNSESVQWAGHPLTPGFLAEIPEWIHSKFKLHIHGHTHDHFDYTMPYGTRVVCNPRGYEVENTNFIEELIINV